MAMVVDDVEVEARQCAMPEAEIRERVSKPGISDGG